MSCELQATREHYFQVSGCLCFICKYSHPACHDLNCIHFSSLFFPAPWVLVFVVEIKEATNKYQSYPKPRCHDLNLIHCYFPLFFH